MAKALLVTRDDIVRYTAVNGGVDSDKFIQFVSISQDIHIQGMLGTRLLEKIQADIIAGTLSEPYTSLLTNYIKPCLIHFAMVEYLPHAAYTIANKGVYKHGSENSESVSKEEVDFLVEKQRQTAMHYKERFIDYVINNSSSFPEYYQNSGSDMFPDQDTSFTGWVL
jgi:hypothetical protein